MNKLKDLWESLAKRNSRYYIYSSCGKKITENEFDDSGWEDYKKYIKNDELLYQRHLYMASSILDVGCGSGRMTKYMAFEFKRVYAVDISKEMITAGRKRLDTLLNIDWHETDGQSLPLSDNTVDIAFSYLVFQHIKDKETVEKLLSEIYRVLKPHGMSKILIRSRSGNSREEKPEVWWSGVHYEPGEALDVWRKAGFYVSIMKSLDDPYAYWVYGDKV